VIGLIEFESRKLVFSPAKRRELRRCERSSRDFRRRGSESPSDLPVGSDATLEERFASGPLAFVRLVAPTTPAERMTTIAEHGTGFVYLISRLGVTGMRDDVASDLAPTIERLRGVTRLPICVGFGISDGVQAAAVGKLADGVVVGSALVKSAGNSVGEALDLTASLRAALDA